MNGQVESQTKLGSAPSAKALTGTEKKCSKCGEIKLIDEFGFSKTAKYGRTERCRECRKEDSQIYQKMNPDRKRASSRAWREKNLEKSNETTRRWKKNNPEKIREANQKIRDTLFGGLNSRMRNAVYQSLRGNKQGCHWETLVGYTVEDLKKHLEKQFKNGMSWENYGLHGWHIDHKIPKSKFHYEKPEDDDFKRCWSLKNLQPLWAIDNLKKWNKIDKPFQPKLIFGG